MNPKKYFKNYHPILCREAWLRSFLCALSVGFGVGFVVGLVLWFTPVNGLWISLAALLATTIIAMPIFYAKKFRPSIIDDARRLDSLGLEERVVTMVEFENSDSYMAQRQRLDAQEALSRVDASQIRMKVSRKILLATSICAILCAAMTTLTILSENGLLVRGNELLEEIIPEEPEVYYAVTYIVEEGGYFEGEEAQLVLAGTNAEPVLAVADDGYVFVEWDDGSGDPARTERNVQQELTFTAIFAPMEGEGEGDGAPSDMGNPGKNEKPGDSGDSNASDGEGEPSDSDQDGGGAGGKYDEWNQIINGEIYYREFLEAYKERLIEQLEKEGDELTEEEKAIIEAYINLV